VATLATVAGLSSPSISFIFPASFSYLLSVVMQQRQNLAGLQGLKAAATREEQRRIGLE
jgi:hypothetical protein